MRWVRGLGNRKGAGKRQEKREGRSVKWWPWSLSQPSCWDRRASGIMCVWTLTVCIGFHIMEHHLELHHGLAQKPLTRTTGGQSAPMAGVFLFSAGSETGVPFPMVSWGAVVDRITRISGSDSDNIGNNDNHDKIKLFTSSYIIAAAILAHPAGREKKKKRQGVWRCRKGRQRQGTDHSRTH